MSDYGGVLSQFQSPEDVVKLGAAAGVTEIEAFEAAYWKDRAAYDRADLTDTQYWYGVTGKHFDDAAIRSLNEIDVESWSRPNLEVAESYSRALEAGIKLALLSNAPLALARDIEQMDWLPPVERYLFSCDLRMTKPDRDIFERAVRELGSLPKRILFVDDREDNVRAAAEVGLQTIHFKDKAQLVF